MILQCEAGHEYEDIPTTEGFYTIKQSCWICGAPIVDVRIGETSRIVGAKGFAGGFAPSPLIWQN